MSGSIQLASSSLLNAAAGRPEFQVRMKHGWSSPHLYQVFGLKNGLLILKTETAGTKAQFDGQLGAVGGLLGGKLGRLVGDILEKAGEVPLHGAENNYSMCSDDELIAKAKSKQHKGSLVAAYDEIESFVLDAATGKDAFKRGGVVGAVARIKITSLGQQTWEFCDQQSIHIASEFFPAKLFDRAKVNLEFDQERMRFVAKLP